MSGNNPTKNPAASLAFTPKPHPDWWAKLVTLAANAVGGSSTGDQHRSYGTDYAGVPRPGDVPRWLPDADAVVDVIIGAMFQTAVVLHLVHLLLFHGGAK